MRIEGRKVSQKSALENPRSERGSRGLEATAHLLASLAYVFLTFEAHTRKINEKALPRRIIFVLPKRLLSYTFALLICV